MSLLTQLLADKGITADTTSKNSSVGRIFGSEPVWSESELQRITQLPRRSWQDNPELEQLRHALTRKYRKAGGDVLFAMQAAALNELYACRRVSVVSGLGTGKTLASALAPMILASKRPLFVNYARLMGKTQREFRVLLDSWHACRDYAWLTIEALSREKQARVFDELQPDFICVDEAHSLANPKGPRFKRLKRYLDEHPECAVLLLTGTPGSESITQYAHLQELLHAHKSPLPRPGEFWHVTSMWAEATDAEVRAGRRPPGALTQLSDGDESLDAVRDGIGRRVEQTTGNIYFRDAEDLGFSLYVTGHKFDRVSSTMDEYCAAARADETLPDGRVFSEVYDAGLILKQLGCGFAKVLDPMPPEPWRQARGLLASFVRETIAQQDLLLDTPLQVVQAIRAGTLDDSGVYAAWLEIQPSFAPKHATLWFDDAVLQYCAEWLARERGLVWTTFPTFGRKLAELTKLPFFHAQGVDSLSGTSIEDYAAGGAILALKPNAYGRNLQRWHKSLYVAPPASATELDQSIGRTARRGQLAPVVEVELLLTVREHWSAVTKARMRAETDRTLGRNAGSRLLACDWLVPDIAEANAWTGPRWSRT